ncbi:MAG TPA: hypothetical protein DDW30_05730 [Clostridiales bacterium]|nr:hypothetical protein [Clostridiales bacterium]
MKKQSFERAAEAFVRFYPPYAWIPSAVIPIYNYLVFFGTRLLDRTVAATYFQTPLDSLIPFVPFFVLFYVLAYLQWGLGYFLTLRYNRRLCYETLSVNLIAKTVCLVCFLAFPTAILRPEVTGGGLWNALVRGIYRIDQPDNLFPSIHCMASWLSFRAVWKVRDLPKPLRVSNGVLTLLVFASTVLIKQHYLPDVLGGVLAVELGYLLTRLLGTERLFRALEPPFAKRVSELHRDVPSESDI